VSDPCLSFHLSTLTLVLFLIKLHRCTSGQVMGLWLKVAQSPKDLSVRVTDYEWLEGKAGGTYEGDHKVVKVTNSDESSKSKIPDSSTKEGKHIDGDVV